MEFSELIKKASEANVDEFVELLRNAKKIISKQKTNKKFDEGKVEGGLITLPAKGTATIVGDLHGDLKSLTFIIQDSGFPADKGSLLVFLGDYGDRGFYSPEVYYIVLSLIQALPGRVLLMRGNHEGPPDMKFYPCDLPFQMNRKFGHDGLNIHRELADVYNMFYHSIIFEGKYLLLHGGAPSKVQQIEDLSHADKLHPKEPHLTEILWNDPEEGMDGTGPSPRGIGRLFGPEVTQQILDLTNTKVLIRGHQVCNGTNINHDGKILTIFSCKEPYELATAAYLKLNLEEEATNAFDLSKNSKYY